MTDTIQMVDSFEGDGIYTSYKTERSAVRKVETITLPPLTQNNNGIIIRGQINKYRIRYAKNNMNNIK